MQVDPADASGCADVVASLLEGRSRLLYLGADDESDALHRVAGWLRSRRGPTDAATVARIQQELTVDTVSLLERAEQMLRAAGCRAEADTVAPFVPFFHQMREMRDACERMHRSYALLREASGRASSGG